MIFVGKFQLFSNILVYSSCIGVIHNFVYLYDGVYMHSFTYSPSHLRLIRRLNGVECKQIVPDTLSALSEYGLLRYRGKRAGLKRIIHQIGSSHSAGNGAAVILGNSVIV